MHVIFVVYHPKQQQKCQNSFKLQDVISWGYLIMLIFNEHLQLKKIKYI